MRMRGDADNVALRSEFVATYLRLLNVRYVLVEAANEEKLSFTFLTIAVADSFSGKNILWKDTLEPEWQRRSHFTLEDGYWVLRNDRGQIHDIH